MKKTILIITSPLWLPMYGFCWLIAGIIAESDS